MATQPPKGSGPQQSSLRAGWIGWLMATIFLIVWNVVVWLRPTPTEIAIPYSSFLAQVSAGNVAGVHIVGDQISGAFKHAILPPRRSRARLRRRAQSLARHPRPAARRNATLPLRQRFLRPSATPA